MSTGRVLAGVEVLLGSLGAVIGTIAISYLGLFYVGLSELININDPPFWHYPGLLHSQPFVNNLLLLFIFCGSHRHWVKNIFSSVFMMSSTIYRQLYFLKSSLALLLISYAWSPQSTPIVWDIPYTPIRAFCYGAGAVGVVITTIAFFSLPALELFGIQEPLERLTGVRKEEAIGLVTDGVYSYVRHPMYTGLLLSAWSHPTMTVSRLVIAVSLMIYILIAVPYFEEPDLIHLFGEQYRHYIKTTPMLFPFRLTSTKTTTEDNRKKN